MKLHPLVFLAALGGSLAVTPAQAGVGVSIRIGVPPPIVVHRAPPHPVPERVVIVSPGPGYVWVPGHYTWVEGQWAWIQGAWVLPPQPEAVWVAGRWDAGAQTWIENHWEVPAPAVPDAPVAPPAPSAGAPVVATPVAPPPAVTEVIIATPPPPPPQEVIGRRPGRSYVWVGGYWGWQGNRHVWVAGHWMRPPRHHAVWVGPRWEHRGGGYVFIQGYWR